MKTLMGPCAGSRWATCSTALRRASCSLAASPLVVPLSISRYATRLSASTRALLSPRGLLFEVVADCVEDRPAPDRSRDDENALRRRQMIEAVRSGRDEYGQCEGPSL